MPETKNNPTESAGMTLLRRAAREDEALVEDCCPRCHSCDLDFEADAVKRTVWCNECGEYILTDSVRETPNNRMLPRLINVSHLEDALQSYDDPRRELKPRELAALVEHAAYLHMQVAELNETLAAERARMRKPALREVYAMHVADPEEAA